MIDLNQHITAIKRFEEIAKEFASVYPAMEGKDKSLRAASGHLVKYWGRANNKLVLQHTGFQKPKEIYAYVNSIVKHIDCCPLMYVEDKDAMPCVSIFRVVSAENNEVAPIPSRTGKLVQPFKLDLSGKIVKEVKPMIVKSWSVKHVIELVLQTLYFNNLLSAYENYNLQGERNRLKLNTERAIKRKELGIPGRTTSTPYARIVSIPMGGMNKKR